MKHRRQLFE